LKTPGRTTPRKGYLLDVREKRNERVEERSSHKAKHKKDSIQEASGGGDHNKKKGARNPTRGQDTKQIHEPKRYKLPGR